MNLKRKSLLILAAFAVSANLGVGLSMAQSTILNVSYDPTRELYKEFNAAFAAKWKAETGETVTIQSRMAVRASRRAR